MGVSVARMSSRILIPNGIQPRLGVFIKSLLELKLPPNAAREGPNKKTLHVVEKLGVLHVLPVVTPFSVYMLTRLYLSSADIQGAIDSHTTIQRVTQVTALILWRYLCPLHVPQDRTRFTVESIIWMLAK